MADFNVHVNLEKSLDRPAEVSLKFFEKISHSRSFHSYAP